ncbi:MAG: response regulator [Elusimicrobiota bacterium]
MKKILLVDDNPSIRRIGKFMLEKNYEVISSSDGQDGVDTAKKELPDLILMDVQMPEMNGIEATKAIKAHPETKNIPVIIVSGQGKETEVMEGMQAGVEDYVVKPFDAEDLNRKIKKYIGSETPPKEPQKGKGIKLVISFIVLVLLGFFIFKFLM